MDRVSRFRVLGYLG